MRGGTNARTVESLAFSRARLRNGSRREFRETVFVVEIALDGRDDHSGFNRVSAASRTTGKLRCVRSAQGSDVGASRTASISSFQKHFPRLGAY